MDVDVLLWGGTHKFEAYELEGKFFVNPGSVTGAVSTGWWADGEEPTPSFCLMDVSAKACGGVAPADKSRPGTRGCAGPVCLPVKDGCERRGECGGRKSLVSKARWSRLMTTSRLLLSLYIPRRSVRRSLRIQILSPDPRLPNQPIGQRCRYLADLSQAFPRLSAKPGVAVLKELTL